MADTFWGAEPGGTKAAVTEASSTQSTSIELRAATTISKEDILTQLNNIIAAVKQSAATP